MVRHKSTSRLICTTAPFTVLIGGRVQLRDRGPGCCWYPTTDAMVRLLRYRPKVFWTSPDGVTIVLSRAHHARRSEGQVCSSKHSSPQRWKALSVSDEQSSGDPRDDEDTAGAIAGLDRPADGNTALSYADHNCQADRRRGLYRRRWRALLVARIAGAAPRRYLDGRSEGSCTRTLKLLRGPLPLQAFRDLLLPLYARRL